MDSVTATVFWLDFTEDELLAMVTRQPCASVREKARDLLVIHYEQESAIAQEQQRRRYLKHTRTRKAKTA